MKRRKRVFVLLICLAIMTSFSCINASAHITDIAQPYYVVTFNTSETFSINSSGVASMTAALVPKNTSKVDSVKVTFTIKNSDGTNIYSKTFTAPWNSLFSEYSIAKSYQLPGRDIYRCNTTYKCYKNNTLVETITTDYIVDSY